MSYIAQIRACEEKLARKRDLEVRLPELEKKKKELEYTAAKRQQAAREEQRDVDRMEAGGPLVALKSLFGGREDRLEKERREACEASSRYQTAVWELDQVTREWDRAKTEWETVKNAEQDYAEALEGRKQELIALGGVRGAEVESLSEDVASLKGQLDRLKAVSDNGVKGWAELKKLEEIMIEADAEVVAGLGFRSKFSERYIERDKAAAALRSFLAVLETFEAQLCKEWLDTNKVTTAMLAKWKELGPLDETDKLMDNIVKIRKTADYIEETKDVLRTVMAELEHQWEPQHERYQKLKRQLKDRILQSCNEW